MKLPRRARFWNLSVNVVISVPSAIPVVTGEARESTVHSTNVDLAFDLFADDNTGVSSGAKIVRTSMRSSRLETDDPWVVVPAGAGL